MKPTLRSGLANDSSAGIWNACRSLSFYSISWPVGLTLRSYWDPEIEHMGIDRIAIIGAGIVGAGIGQAATSNGYMVILEDIEPSAWIRQLGR
jgi:hypothetical protein